MMKKQFPKPTGEYAVGTFTYTIKDNRKEVLPASGMRSIAARVYYPVLKESVQRLEKLVGLSENMIKGFKASFHVAPDFKKNPEDNISECYINAPKISGKKFPLVMFNHGYNSYREGNSFLCIELASHGYVVISVAHSYEALCTEFDDGTFILSDKKNIKLYEPMLGGLIAMYKLTKSKGSDEELAQQFDEVQKKYCRYMRSRFPEWIKDNEAALDYAKENLADMIDFSKGVGASGHSFGGNTAYALCARNKDFVCGINIDGGLFGDYTNDIMAKPFMQISCKDNEKAAARVYLRHTKPVYKVLFRDMKHIGFADSKYTMPINSVVGKLDADVMHYNFCKCHLEFFDAYLKGVKVAPEIASNGAVTVSVFQPDIDEIK
jgi:dienelactone hydrolase